MFDRSLGCHEASGDQTAWMAASVPPAVIAAGTTPGEPVRFPVPESEPGYLPRKTAIAAAPSFVVDRELPLWAQSRCTRAPASNDRTWPRLPVRARRRERPLDLPTPVRPVFEALSAQTHFRHSELQVGREEVNQTPIRCSKNGQHRSQPVHQRLAFPVSALSTALSTGAVDNCAAPEPRPDQQQGMARAQVARQ